jgi:hypothetical protein
MNVFVFLRIESERMYEMFQFAIEFLNWRFQDLIIIREQIFDLIQRKKSTIWELYHLFMQFVNEFDEIVVLINRHISNIHENMMKMFHSYELSSDRSREFNVIFEQIFEIQKWNTFISNDFFHVFVMQLQMQIHRNNFVFQSRNVD